MMVAIIEGMVLEVFEKEDRDSNKKVPCIRMFQQGEKKLVEVKGVPKSIVKETGGFISLKCKLFPWANERGLADISCSYIED